MKEWKTCKVKDLAIMKNGKKRPNTVGHYPVYGGNGIMDYCNTYNNENTIIIGRVGAYCGNVFYCKDKCWVSDNAIALCANSDNNIKYLYYLLASLDLHHNHIGGAQPLMTQDIIGNFDVCVPNLKTQIQIANILSSIDKKIELNRQINDNLEQQAQALYKSWFVDFKPFKDGEFIESELGLIPEGWSIIKVGELPLYISDYVSNGSFASLKENVTLYETPNYAQFIRNTDLKSQQFSVWVDEASYKFLGKSKLTGGEIIISNVGDVGSVHLCPKLRIPMTLGNNVIMIKPIDIVYNYFIYMTFKWFYGRDLIKGITGGSAMPKFNKTDFKSLKLAIPDYSTLSKFNSLASKLMEQVINLNHSNQRLSQTRDTLLPKLMSGELKINEIDC